MTEGHPGHSTVGQPHTHTWPFLSIKPSVGKKHESFPHVSVTRRPTMKVQREDMLRDKNPGNIIHHDNIFVNFLNLSDTVTKFVMKNFKQAFFTCIVVS